MERQKIRKPVPIKFSALIGDFIHNLRTALDLLVCDLVTINGKSTKEVYFPFCASPAELPRMIRDRKIYRAGPDIVAYIESLKPYTGGNIALRAIHDLDVTDKHHALLPVISGVKSSARKNLRNRPSALCWSLAKHHCLRRANDYRNTRHFENSARD